MVSKNKTRKRTKYKDNLILELWAKAAARCEFRGCNDFLYLEKITFSSLQKSNIAHIIASSQKGPRGGNSIHEDKDIFFNLMLLCKDHHTLIDNKEEEYSVEDLRNMKANMKILLLIFFLLKKKRLPLIL